MRVCVKDNDLGAKLAKRTRREEIEEAFKILDETEFSNGIVMVRKSVCKNWFNVEYYLKRDQLLTWAFELGLRE